MPANHNDPVVDEVREVRCRISARFDHDPARLVAYYLAIQKTYQDRLVKPAASREEKDHSAACAPLVRRRG